MSDTFNMTIPQSEQEKFRRWTNKISADTRKQLQSLVVKTAYNIHHRAAAKAPVRYGFLRSSGNVSLTADRLGAKIEFWADYAPYQEFGTGRGFTVGQPDSIGELYGLMKYAYQFKGTGRRKHNMRAQAFLFPSVRIEGKKFIGKLNQMGFK